ncbi:MAG: DUF2100 domain-containing protein [Candidatus Hermodarchaeota archaeon]
MKQKINSEEVKAILAALNDLIEIKVLIRGVAPNYNLDDDFNNELIQLLKALRLKLQPIFSKYLDIGYFKENSINQKEIDMQYIIELIKKKKHIIVSASNSKKKLKNFGIDPRIIIVTGGPLFVENYKKVNPTLTNNALLGIKKKCESLINQIKKLAKKAKELIFIYEKDNLTDQIILKELDLLENTTDIKIKSYNIKSWKNFEFQSKP